MSADEKVAKRSAARWFEHGRTMGAPEWRLAWVRVGPFVAEAHAGVFRLGLTAGPPGYVGLLLGPFVLTVGRRRYSTRPAQTWTVTLGSPAPVQEADRG